MASTRLSECFKALQSQGRKALIPYVTAGDPTPDETVNLMHT
ncbi:MAG: tryptophan synthase subunit alpha, partial [Burkholderiaceae bacterium]